jgi:glucokinase
MTSTTAPIAGIDLGGTKIEAAVFDAEHKLLGSARRPTPATGGPPDVAEAMADALQEACATARIDGSDLAAVGVGSPGVVDSSAGTVSGARNLPGWTGTFELGPALAKRLGVPVAVGNDVEVATDAEFALGAGRPYTSLLGVFWGTGVGGGLVLDSKRWRGRGAAGEIGHTVVKLNGRRCPCGRDGCLEAYAGRGAMEARARKLHDEGQHTDLFKIMQQRRRTKLTSAVWGHALEHGDKMAGDLIEEAVQALGAGIASAVNLLDVEAVVIGGGLGVRFGEPMVRRIEQAMAPHVFNDSRPPAVHVAALGDLGGAIGAALLARDSAAYARPKRSARSASRSDSDSIRTKR